MRQESKRWEQNSRYLSDGTIQGMNIFTSTRQGQPDIENIMAVGTDKKPFRFGPVFLKHGVEPIFIVADRTYSKFGF
jgi:hypothetical protein